jgi:hypothetical protein
MVAMMPVATVMTPTLRAQPPLRFFFDWAAVEPVAVETALPPVGDPAERDGVDAERSARSARREAGEEEMAVVLWSGFERSLSGPGVLVSAKV